ncbi:MAG TPA: hypothetical protein DCM64_00875 [Gammaproteobacteria bacterium]|jgi:hypothetical protein|nr:hypothetical protein [Gammaproteobacteria bacterium]
MAYDQDSVYANDQLTPYNQIKEMPQWHSLLKALFEVDYSATENGRIELQNRRNWSVSVLTAWTCMEIAITLPVGTKPIS